MKLAEAISERVPSCERVRLMNSGTEATSTAVRLARGATGRDRIVTFAGNFHGATDALLVAGGSGVATLGLPGTAGVPAVRSPRRWWCRTTSCRCSTSRSPRSSSSRSRRTWGSSPRRPGFLAGLRAECDRVGALLIFDEVITGFRIGPGGAQAKYDVTPDLTCFGKVIGGGLPIGAVGGRAELMEHLSPLGPVFHAGTLAGNPMATAAGLAALDQLDGDVYIELMARARHLSSLLRDACSLGRAGGDVPGGGHAVRHRVWRCGRRGANFDDAKRTDEAMYAAFFQAMLAEGVAMAPGRIRGDLRRAGSRRRGARSDRRGGASGGRQGRRRCPCRLSRQRYGCVGA